MHRREQNIALILVSMAGPLLLAAGVFRIDAPSMLGLALLIWVGVTSAWIVVKGRVSIRRAQAQGYKVLVPLKASALTQAIVLWSLGFRHPGGPATEYHVRPKSGKGASVVRRAMSDLDRISREAPSPSLHLLAWHGMSHREVQRLLMRFLHDNDKLMVWQRGHVTFGVVIREESAAVGHVR